MRGPHPSLAFYTSVFLSRQEVALKWRELAFTWMPLSALQLQFPWFPAHSQEINS